MRSRKMPEKEVIGGRVSPEVKKVFYFWLRVKGYPFEEIIKKGLEVISNGEKEENNKSN